MKTTEVAGLVAAIRGDGKRLADGTTKEYPAYWYRFKWNGRLIRVNTKQPNNQAAAQFEAQQPDELAKGDAGIRDRSKVPTLKEYEALFMGHIEVRCKDIELAKSIASKRGTGYQTVLKEAIRRGLKRAG